MVLTGCRVFEDSARDKVDGGIGWKWKVKRTDMRTDSGVDEKEA